MPTYKAFIDATIEIEVQADNRQHAMDVAYDRFENEPQLQEALVYEAVCEHAEESEDQYEEE